MTTLQAIALAIIEGITEFLASFFTGHMIIASSFLGLLVMILTNSLPYCNSVSAILSVVVYISNVSFRLGTLF
jgi:undecaprenyl-diphosphatase